MGENLAEPAETANSQSQDAKPELFELPDDAEDSLDEVRSSRSSAVSRTSTEEFGHVSFEPFSQQVKDLCHTLWPSTDNQARPGRSFWGRRFRTKSKVVPARQVSGPTEFMVEKLLGGGFNRVIAVTKHSENTSPTCLVLRVPRFETAQHEREVAATRFVRQNTAIPVPEVKFVDFTSNNPLSQRYVIQTRIPGFDLQCENHPCFYPSLSHEQKCTVATRLAEILIELHKVSHPFPGNIEDSGLDESNGKRTFSVHHFDLRWTSNLEPEHDLKKNSPFFQPLTYTPDWKLNKSDDKPFEETTLYFMLAQFGRWRALELRRDPVSIGYMDYYDRLVMMAKQMDELGFLGQNDNCLCHRDLNSAPRNIMVEIDANKSLSITGILDWDSLIFAPRFMACVPPMWLWAWDDVEEEDEKKANDLPSTVEQQELKSLFERSIGNWFCEYAYRPEFWMARRLFLYAYGGMSSDTDIHDVNALLAQWQEFYHSQTANSAHEADGSESVQSAGSPAVEGTSDVK